MPRQVVYLARHGQTALNAEGRIRGLEDPDLDEAGRAQAAALGRAFLDVPLRWVASSPLGRARQTAAAVAEPHELQPFADPHLNDRDYGQWGGQVTAEVVARFGSVDAAPGVEAWAAFSERSARRFVELVAEQGDTPGVIVAHDAVNRAILQRLFALDPATTSQRTGCWNELHVEDGGWTLVLLDQLPPS